MENLSLESKIDEVLDYIQKDRELSLEMVTQMKTIFKDEGYSKLKHLEDYSKQELVEIGIKKGVADHLYKFIQEAKEKKTTVKVDIRNQENERKIIEEQERKEELKNLERQRRDAQLKEEENRRRDEERKLQAAKHAEETRKRQMEIEALKAEKEKMEQERIAQEKELKRIQSMERNKTDQKRYEEELMLKRQNEDRERQRQKEYDEEQKREYEYQKEKERIEETKKKEQEERLKVSKTLDHVKAIIGKKSHSFQGSILQRNMKFSTISMSGEYVFYSSTQTDTPAYLQSIKNPKDTKTFTCEYKGKFISSCRALVDKNIVVLGYNNGKVDSYEISSKRKLATMSGHRGAEIEHLRIENDNNRVLLFSSAKGKAHIVQWDPLKGEQKFEYVEKSSITTFQFGYSYIYDTDIPILLVASEDGSLSLYNTLNGKLLKGIPQAHSKSINCLAQEQIGNDLKDVCFTGSSDATIGIWDIVTGKNLGFLKGHTQSIMCIGADKDLLVSGSSDETARVWNSNSQQCLYVLEPHKFFVSNVFFKKNRIYTSGGGGEVGCWDITNEKCLDLITAHSAPINYLFEYGGKVITGSNSDDSLRLSPIAETRKLHDDDEEEEE